MGCRELIESLRQAGDGRARAARAEAEQEAERIKADAAGRIARVREANERKRADGAARHEATVLAEANAEARRIRIRADRLLAERLQAAARSGLSSLRNVGYEGVFRGFAREMPRVPWKKVQVNPADEPLAREIFPDAEIVTDSSITGGFVALSEGDQVRVVNTFEKRLERLWDEILPDMINEVREMFR
ncbi:MAG: V-type ATP synthase subunit E family protein [Nitrospirota bacterium]|nr:V-type ATP synthase subunit E family protein [Nitrospirota bacterium]